MSHTQHFQIISLTIFDIVEIMSSFLETLSRCQIISLKSFFLEFIGRPTPLLSVQSVANLNQFCFSVGCFLEIWWKKLGFGYRKLKIQINWESLCIFSRCKFSLKILLKFLLFCCRNYEIFHKLRNSKGEGGLRIVTSVWENHMNSITKEEIRGLLDY